MKCISSIISQLFSQMSTWVFLFFKGYQLSGFFLYVHVITMKPKFYRRLRGKFFFVILVRLFLYHGINSHLVLNPYSQLVSADKIFTHTPRAGTQCLGLNLLKSFATLKIMGYLDRISVYTYQHFQSVVVAAFVYLFCFTLPFFLSLFPCYLFVKLFVDLFSYSYILVCLEI